MSPDTTRSFPANDLVERLVFQILEASDSDQALALACQEHPEQSATIKRVLAHLQAFSGLSEQTGLDETKPPRQFGSFDLLQKLGGGGMGTVYLA